MFQGRVNRIICKPMKPYESNMQSFQTIFWNNWQRRNAINRPRQPLFLTEGIWDKMVNAGNRVANVFRSGENQKNKMNSFIK